MMSQIGYFFLEAEKLISIHGIIIINICLIFTPFFLEFGNTTYFLTSKLREVLVFSLGLSVPEFISYTVIITRKKWKSPWTLILQLIVSVASILLLFTGNWMKVAVLVISLKFVASIFVCCFNLYLKGNYHFKSWIFKLMILCFTSATSISSWLLYYNYNNALLFIYCFLSLGACTITCTYYLYVWLYYLSKFRELGFEAEKLHESVDVVALYLLCTGHLIILSTCFSSSKFHSFETYFMSSILLVSILMHIVWFCHGQVDMMEKDRANVSSKNKTFHIRNTLTFTTRS